MFKYRKGLFISLLTSLTLISTFVEATVPNAPGAYLGVTAIEGSKTSVRVNFLDNSNNEDGFRIFDGEGINVAVSANDEIESSQVYKNLTALICDHVYTIKAVAHKDGVDSEMSDSRTFNIHTTFGIPCDDIPVQHAPVADAGDDKQVEVDTLISIVGTGTDDGVIVSYKWEENGIELATSASFDYSSPDEGNHTLVLTVTDNDGLVATDELVINVISDITLDVMNPIITLLGESNISIVKGTIYIDAGATATDNIDGNITDDIVIVNPVDTDAAIDTEFIVRYTVLDNAGNNATVIRNVTIVRDLNISFVDWIANGNGNWVVQSDNKSVKQTLNNNPTIYHNNVDSQSNIFKLSGQITVETASDDDYIGFVLGYHNDDVDKDDVDYLLIDWKKGNQVDPIGNAIKGLAISRVSKKLGNTAGAWIHSSADGVTELQRATTLGNKGWVTNKTYTFEITFTKTLVEVFIDDVKELSVSGVFNNGAYGFYNYSQANVLYSTIEVNLSN